MKYLIIATPRTGSTYLVHGLRPSCKGEIWLKYRTVEYGYDFHKTRTEPHEYFDQIIADGEGAKIHTTDPGDHTTDLERLQNVDRLFDKVDLAMFLRRKNLTEQAISLLLAKAFGYHKPIMKKEYEPIELNIEELKKLADLWFAQYHKWLERAKPLCEVISVWYEDICEGQLSSINSIRKTLGLPTVNKVKTDLVILRSKSKYREIITNYNEIIQEMGCEYGVPFVSGASRWQE